MNKNADNIEQSLSEIRDQINELRDLFLSDKIKVSLECLDKILKLQHKASELQIALHGNSKVEANLICSATCMFCESALKEIGKTGCNKKTKNKHNCKVRLLFENFYELFK